MREYQILSGNYAAARTAYPFTDTAFVYPITPSSDMAEQVSDLSLQNHKNLWGQTVSVTQMQSETGVAAAMHGALASGSLATTFTSSQGLLLMLPNLYKIAGERLPGVFYVASRTIATHALSIFGDHSDVYAVRQSGVAILCASSVQEIIDLAPVAHLSALTCRLPFIFFFDGFRTSHELQKIQIWKEQDLADFLSLKEIEDFRKNALNPCHPYVMGSSQGPDIYFQQREACNLAYTAACEIVAHKMDMINERLGTSYAPFQYYGDANALHVIVSMGSVNETVKKAVDFLNARGEKVGLINVRLFRPFSAAKFLECLPTSVTHVSVLDRAKEPGSGGEALYLDVLSAMHPTFSKVTILHGRYGLSSKDTTPDQIVAVFHNKERKEFTIGIDDDVTHLSLPVSPVFIDAQHPVCAKFWGMGSDGSVGACKCAACVIGNGTSLFAQAYSEYDSRKSGGLTISHLRYDKSSIHAPYLIHDADFIICSHLEYLERYPIVEELKEGGSLLINTSYEKAQFMRKLSPRIIHMLIQKKAHLYTINAQVVSQKSGLGKHTGIVMVAAFFSIANIMPMDQCHALLKKQILVDYQDKGDAVVNSNYNAIKLTPSYLQPISLEHDAAFANNRTVHTQNAPPYPSDLADYLTHIHRPVHARRGDNISVSSFIPYADGSCPSGTAAYDKKASAIFVPVWNPEQCIQCNHCSFVCPHSVIRPFALTAKEANATVIKNKPIPMTAAKHLQFFIGISAMDCTGCASCIVACPAPKKALRMSRLDQVVSLQDEYDYVAALPEKKEIEDYFHVDTVKGSQFRRPLLEFPGACGGCGQTPYVKLLTQLFGERMLIANATGCSSIWGNSSPSVPYTKLASGRGPAWSNSLFEDAAEFGYGMLLGYKDVRTSLHQLISSLITKDTHSPFYDAALNWLNTYSDGERNTLASDRLIECIRRSGNPSYKLIDSLKDYLSKKSHWIFGGDGWAYDIGFGGLDHVLSSGEDINILIFDNEAYANTGGQPSKATPRGAVTALSKEGKKTAKKDLASYLIGLGNVYVAQIAMGADMNQCIKSMIQAEHYPGPSVLLAYSPCTCHGIRGSMSHAQTEQLRAVQSGYWKLFRYHPKDFGYKLDSATPSMAYEDFLDGEQRFALLDKESKLLRSASKADAQKRL
ncbi:pyruvate:ferredoxin (flavodoxin) oxidoreductase [Eubacterium oxidoreducens]|uniref:Pyruvate:ferredoxin oxidoreductase n=1 Tax=Eubacterium oxidoreducens TaxID=1732 RepID=A0A1G6BR14_EUBOX|nr:pyruvate:ferredoxin (flavodoxin) oxidoreductase [Eubacterium oxidoreducens]SDB23039.1 pyruvate-ferredoxin/flavodoxin oxidoreductase [Eubacterium oxidoreducens]